MKILVAGAAGFLGTNLCSTLLSEEHEVVGIDNLYTGNFENLSTLDQFKNFKFIHHDINQKLSLRVDAIFNLASPASPVQYQRDPVYTLKTNFIGTANLLDLAMDQNARFIQASTSEVYGDPHMSPQSESYWGNVNPTGIRSCYDEGKRAAETLISDYKRQFNADVRIARIFNTYGPFMAVNDGRVVSNFVNQALRGQDLTVFGDGTQIRSFCYVDDLIKGLVAMLLANAIEGPVNLGNPDPITMRELAREIISLLGSKSSIKHLEIPQDDPRTRIPDITKATKLLGWQPEIGRSEGLSKTIMYFENRV